jgi:hypothetical protein
MLQEYPWLIPVVFLVVGGGISLLLSFLNKGKKTGVAEEPKEKELTERFIMSRYLCGFPNAATPAPIAYCGVTEESFLFSKGSRGVEIGRIHRDSIHNVIVAKKSQVVQQLTAEEKSAFGKVFESNIDNSSCLVLSWEDSDKKKHNSVFEFTEQASADSSAQQFKKWMKPSIAKAS